MSEFPQRYLAEAISGSPVHYALVAATADPSPAEEEVSCRPAAARSASA